jgi:hypothetical protein
MLLLAVSWITLAGLGGGPNPRLALVSVWLTGTGLGLLLVALLLQIVGYLVRPRRRSRP